MKKCGYSLIPISRKSWERDIDLKGYRGYNVCVFADRSEEKNKSLHFAKNIESVVPKE